MAEPGFTLIDDGRAVEEAYGDGFERARRAQDAGRPVALDRSPAVARPWIDAAKPEHPSLIDTRHVVADLYNMVNVPTIVWIDERGRIVRPNDVAFGTDTFKHITGLEAAKHLGALRAWVRGEAPPLPKARTQALQSLPTDTDQHAPAR